MGKDKQKFIILGVLFVALAGVGAYQFIGGSSSDDKPAAKKAKDSTESTGITTNEVSTQDPPLYAYNTTFGAKKDPFEPGKLYDTPEDSDTEPDPGPTRNTSSGGGSIRRDTDTGAPPWWPPDGTTQVTPEVRNEFTYSLVGIVEGPNPVAVFEDSSGSQRLVRVGEYVGQDSKVTAISNGEVVVDHDGETIKNYVGGKSK